MRPKDFDVQELIYDLLGTCSNIEDHLPEGMEYDDLTTEDLQVIDDQIMLCEQCGWWVELDECFNEDGYCHDCRDDDNQYEYCF